MMNLPYHPVAGRAGLRVRRLAVALGVLAALASTGTMAQAPAANQGVSAATPFSDQELEQLVAPFALYPDDLVALILPASTNPLQLVQADRFLDKRKQNPKLELDPKWDDPVKNLLNYPDVVKKMSADLEWTAMLGEAVVADQGEVLEAVQAFRRKTVAAGNLKSDDKQQVVVEKEVVQIVPANPEVIYVPQYNPTTVVVAGGYVPAYYPSPYPVYYYPYAPGAALATGLIWGAAMGAIWSGNHYNTNWGGGGNNNINIDVDRGDRNVDRGDRNVDRSRTQNNAGGGNRGSGSQAWSSNKKPGQVSGSAGVSSGKRPGDVRTSGAGAGGGAGNRAGTQPAGGGAGGNRGGGQAGSLGGSAQAGGLGGGGGGGGGGAGAGGARASAQPVGGGAGGGGGGAFDVSSGRQTQMDSARGASSRGASGGGAGASSTRSAPASRPSGGGGGGGARASGGGGGGRGGGGGGGRGGGGRR